MVVMLLGGLALYLLPAAVAAAAMAAHCAVG